MIGIDWMPEEPVPMTPTRLPVRSTPSWGQRLVKYTSPWKRSVPSMSTSLGTDRHPVAITYQRQRMVSPWLVVIDHVDDASSHAAALTPVSKRMSRRRS